MATWAELGSLWGGEEVLEGEAMAGLGQDLGQPEDLRVGEAL